MTKIDSLAKSPEAGIDPEFKENWPGGISTALRSLAVGESVYWDADEFKHRSFHSIANRIGIKIETKRCRNVSAAVVLRRS